MTRHHAGEHAQPGHHGLSVATQCSVAVQFILLQDTCAPFTWHMQWDQAGLGSCCNRRFSWVLKAEGSPLPHPLSASARHQCIKAAHTHSVQDLAGHASKKCGAAGVDVAPMLAVMLLRALLALTAGTWSLLRQRGFWVAIAGCVLFNRVYYAPGAPKVRCPEPALARSTLGNSRLASGLLLFRCPPKQLCQRACCPLCAAPCRLSFPGILHVATGGLQSRDPRTRLRRLSACLRLHQVEAPCAAAPWEAGSANPAAVPQQPMLSREAAPREEGPSRWWGSRRRAPPEAAAGRAPPGAAPAPRTLWEFRRARPLFSDAVRRPGRRCQAAFLPFIVTRCGCRWCSASVCACLCGACWGFSARTAAACECSALPFGVRGGPLRRCWAWR